MAASVRQTVVYDPAPNPGAPVDLGGGLGDGFIFAVSANTLAGSCLAGVMCCAYDTNGLVTATSDSVNGAWTLLDDLLDKVYANQDFKTFHFPNAAALSANAANFTGSVNGSNFQLTTSSVTGTIRPGQLLLGASVGAMWRVVSQVSGTAGGAGVYQLNPIATTTIAAEAMTTADAITVTVNGFPDYIGGAVWEVTGASQSGVTAHAAQLCSADGSTDSDIAGPMACGSSPGIILGLGMYDQNQHAVDPGTGFTSDGAIWAWNFPPANGKMEHGYFVNPGTRGATFTPTGGAATLQVFGMFIPDASGGGNIYNVSLAEAGSAADLPSAAALYAGAITESGSAADVWLASAAYTGNIAEVVTATDLLSYGSIYTVGITETGAAVDSLTYGTTYSVSITETGSAADAPLGQASYTTGIAEVGSAAAALTFTTTYSVTLTEAGSALDATGATAVFAAAVVAAANSADALNAIANYLVSVAEAGSASDIESNGSIYSGAVLETGSAVDVLQAVTSFAVSIQEAGNVADSYVAAAAFVAALAENGAAADTLSAVAAFLAACAEAGAAADAVANTLNAIVAIAESGAAADTLSVFSGVPIDAAATLLTVLQAQDALTMLQATDTLELLQ